MCAGGISLKNGWIKCACGSVSLMVGKGRVDLTIGSALDIFAGDGEGNKDAVQFNHTLSALPKQRDPQN